ncbi:MAG: hypothetical protein GF331_22820 [Chitinivibrionales bacterium]|nr:hypothetical protein [Chitinivibrionales bacterium]
MARAWVSFMRFLAISSVLCCMCDSNPFTPDTGVPITTGGPESQRATPVGVIDQLLTAYENQSSKLFVELFPADKSFRFYVSPRLIESGTDVNIVPEEIDTSLKYVPQGTYRYWTHDSEVRSHERLFSEAAYIRVEAPPVFDEEDFCYHLNDSGDTVGVEVLMLGGELLIGLSAGAYTEEQHPVVIERQVFYLERGADNLWVIKKWFDFGTTG